MINTNSRTSLNSSSWNSPRSSTDKTKCCHQMSLRQLLKLIAQILVPLMIGTFTIVIALQQHNLGIENRKKDIDIALKLREQELQVAEKNRAQELALDEARRMQDLSINDNRQRDSVFNIYIRDVTNYLVLNNYVLNRAMLDSIIRPMTLNVLRQLDPSRKVLLLKFLYETKMIRTDYEQTRIDLTDGDLNGIELKRIRMENLSLPGTSMNNASFINMDLSMADFQGADLTDASFINTQLIEACFYRTRLIRVRFDQSDLTLIDLDLADLTQSIITKYQLQSSVSYNMAKMPNGTAVLSSNLIYSEDKWNINPKDSVNLTDQGYFIAMKDNITMSYSIPVFLYKRLFERRQALLEFRFQAKRKNQEKLRIYFIYFDEHGNNEIHREAGIIIGRLTGTSGNSFSRYEVTADYPHNAFYLYIEIFLNIGDIYKDFQLNIQHFDYHQFQYY